MSNTMQYKPLSNEQIVKLDDNGCSALNWEDVKAAEGFDPSKVKNTAFKGPVNLGSNVCIENVGSIEVSESPCFGSGIEVKVINEAGGREVKLFNELNAQFAYLTAMHRHRPQLTGSLKRIADSFIDSDKQNRCTIGDNSVIRCVKQIRDVNIGAYAVVNGASSLVNGTILSESDAPTIIGTDVIAEDFIVAEGAVVENAACIEKVFVGQGTVIGKQFSAENCLFFANCQMFNGEAVSVFAGPYTVSHHKSTLLIAGVFSFFNAGSGTNQSNHMYRIGPVHEGKLLRGAKTGSFSYMLWPSVVGPFSVVLGKHGGGFDLGDFPFSMILAGTDGKTHMQPAVQFNKTGTVRDCIKWSKRDKRKGENKRDIIDYGLLTPFTVGKMIKAKDKLASSIAESSDEIEFNGVVIKRTHAQKAMRIYKYAIEIYLLERIVAYAAKRFEQGVLPDDVFQVDSNAVFDAVWIDIAGQLLPKANVDEICDLVETGSVNTIEAFGNAFARYDRQYAANEWAWVVKHYEQIFEEQLSVSRLGEICDRLLRAKTDMVDALIADAEKEYAPQSRLGYGDDGIDAHEDFENVRGRIETDDFIKSIKTELAELEKTVAAIKRRIG